ncbi:hypothetical protein C0J52_17810 [Blattella germanica]|nr:hypothetical protein C0J52_17810 [Blattella germanica]
MGRKSKTGLVATAFAGLGFLFVFIAFVSPYWLETDDQLKDPKFLNIGLWQVCFQGFDDPRHWYDTKFYGCWWVFEEEYYIIHEILLPALYLCCSRNHERFVLLLLVVGTDLLIAAVSGTIAVIIFGARGDGRDWMPNWEHNNISWSYALAVFGVFFLYICGILFVIEGRVHHKKRLREREATHSGYHMEQRKAQTTI